MGLSEVMASAGKHQLLAYMGELIPTIRTALCDRYDIRIFQTVLNYVCIAILSKATLGPLV